MAGESKSSPRRIEAAQKAAQAVELRKARVTYERIAEVLGYASKSGAYAAVQAALKEVKREPAAELLTLELLTLDDLQFAHMPLAKKGHLAATDKVLKIMELRARYVGLFAPDKGVNFDIDWDSLTDEQLERIEQGEDPFQVVIGSNASTKGKGGAGAKKATKAKPRGAKGLSE